MKYIVFAKEVGDSMLATPVLFPNCISHLQVKLIGGHKPISAGFVNAKGEACGDSESLGLQSHPDDTELIRRAMNNYGDTSWYLINKRD